MQIYAHFQFYADLYTFDICEKAAEETYNEVCYAYAELFTKLGLPVMKGEHNYIIYRYYRIVTA